MRIDNLIKASRLPNGKWQAKVKHGYKSRNILYTNEYSTKKAAIQAARQLVIGKVSYQSNNKVRMVAAGRV